MIRIWMYMDVAMMITQKSDWIISICKYYDILWHQLNEVQCNKFLLIDSYQHTYTDTFAFGLIAIICAL